MKQKRIWTIGHSTHPIEKFNQMLKSFGITALVDVRSLPGSRKFPQFDKEALEKSYLKTTSTISTPLTSVGEGKHLKPPKTPGGDWHRLEDMRTIWKQILSYPR
jgi:hypothetical protein